MNLIYLINAMFSFMLCMIALLLPKYNTTWYFTSNLSLLTSFSILFPIAEFIEMQRLGSPDSVWLTWHSFTLMLASYLPLLEYSRRKWNSFFGSVKLSAIGVLGSISVVMAGLVFVSSGPTAEIIYILRQLVVSLAALLVGVALSTAKSTADKRLPNNHNAFWTIILALVFTCYAASALFLFDMNPTMSLGLHTSHDIFPVFGLSVDLLRTLLSTAASLGLVSLVLLAGDNCQMDSIVFGWSNKAIFITDVNNVILRINNTFKEYTGFNADEVVDKKICIINSGHHKDTFYVSMWDSLQRTGTWEGEIWGRRKDGVVYPSWLTITGVKDIAGTIIYYVGMFIDISQQKAQEAEMRRQALYDPLTNLPNRLLMYERLKYSLNMESRSGRNLAVLMLDLDRFKSVNDRLGHLAGDELLQQVASRIKGRLRDVDLVARLGGDEFIILLDDINHPKDASRVAQDIISDLSRPFKLSQSDEVWIGASVGISLYHQHGDSPEVLLDNADKALYQAKDKGRGCFAYFSEDLTIAARKRVELETGLRRAILQDELRVHYQPQVDIYTGLIVGAEALVRWEHPTEGLISPARFIPIAEESNLIMDIGEWVLRETCYQGQYWLASGLPALSLAVNISSHQFRRVDLNALITKVLAETGFPAQFLELEITESGIMENQQNATAILNNLRKQGIRLAIDDFGTGYSSLAYLKSFPLNVLKIDKSFIDDIPNSKDGMEIAATIIGMGRTLGLKVLAEGVETPEQLAFLQKHGCDIYQGYLKSKPLKASEFAELLRHQQKGNHGIILPLGKKMRPTESVNTLKLAYKR